VSDPTQSQTPDADVAGGSTFDVIATVMREQVPARRLAADPIDDATVLAVLDLASRAGAGNRWRCEFVVVRDPDVRHQLARIHRQGWSIYRRFLRTRSGEDAELEARQWEADHFEDVPVLIVPCVRGRRPRFPAAGAAAFYGAAYPAVQNLLLAATALGLGAGVTNLALWSSWQARRTLALPRNVTPVAVVPLGRLRGPVLPPPVPPLENLVHLDRFGHQPFRPNARRSIRDVAL
jgi:nitroreductase